MRVGGIVFLACIGLAGCTGAQVRPTDAREEASAVEAANQHVALAVLVSMHFCKKGEWPSAVEDAQTYATESEIQLPVMPDWNLWMDPAITYTATRDLLLNTPALDREGYGFPVSTTVNPPGCDQGNIDVRPHIKIGQ